MLEKEDLQALQKMFSDSEERMMGKLQESEGRMTGKMQGMIQESEERMTGKMQGMIQESEERMTGKIQKSEDRAVQKAMVMMEQYFDPKFNLLAENQQMILEKMVPLSRVEKIEGDVDLLKIIIRQMREEIDQLKGA